MPTMKCLYPSLRSSIINILTNILIKTINYIHYSYQLYNSTVLLLSKKNFFITIYIYKPVPLTQDRANYSKIQCSRFPSRATANLVRSWMYKRIFCRLFKPKQPSSPSSTNNYKLPYTEGQYVLKFGGYCF